MKESLLAKIFYAQDALSLETKISAWLQVQPAFTHIEFHYSVCHESFSVLILYKEAPPK